MNVLENFIMIAIQYQQAPRSHNQVWFFSRSKNRVDEGLYIYSKLVFFQSKYSTATAG